MNVALLNASYEPLGTVSVQHAVRMLFRQWRRSRRLTRTG
jgi:hypothetical protein